MAGQQFILLDRGVKAELERGMPAHLTCEHPRDHRQHRVNHHVWVGVITIGCDVTRGTFAGVGIAPTYLTQLGSASAASSCRSIHAALARVSSS
jgi:hypothetical protein